MTIYDVRPQIAEELNKIAPAFLVSPEEELTAPFLTYAEVTCVDYSKGHVRLEYQVDCYETNFGDLMALVKQVIETMHGIGFDLTYETPDANTRRDSGDFWKALNFAGVFNVDTGFSIRNFN